MGKLILLRHGQSIWNQLNLFTGWVDVPLSLKGIEEAVEAGKILKNIPIDVIYTSTLIRGSMTAMIVMAHHSSGKTPVMLHTGEGKLDEWGQIYSEKAKESIIPVISAWQLNERMYGELQGLNKQETADKFGADQVKIWRRSFDIQPPNGESLEMTAARTLPYFNDEILPRLQNGENVFISAHGNSLRSIIMELDNLSKEEVLHLELATGIPVVYHWINGHFKKESK